MTSTTPDPKRERIVVIDAGLVDTRFALIDAGDLIDFHPAGPWAEPEPSMTGRVYAGRVTRLLKGANAALVEIGLSEPGFLSAKRARTGPPGAAPVRIERLVHEGESLLLQAVSDPRPGKGAHLTRNLTIAGRYTILAPNCSGISLSRRIGADAERTRLTAALSAILNGRTGAAAMGWTVRAAAAGAPTDVLSRDVDRLLGQWRRIGERWTRGVGGRLDEPADGLQWAVRDFIPEDVHGIQVTDRAAAAALRQYLSDTAPHLSDRVQFASAPDDMRQLVADAVDRATQPIVELPSGGRISIETTAAVTAIDVDSASASPAGTAEQIAVRVNSEAMLEIARQLRLRDLGGLIVVDALRMREASSRKHMIDALRRAMSTDPAAHRVGTLSPFGLLELTRRSLRGALALRLFEGAVRPAPLRRLRFVVGDLFADIRRVGQENPGRRILIVTSSDISDWIDTHGAAAYGALSNELGFRLERICERDWPACSYDVRP